MFLLLILVSCFKSLEKNDKGISLKGLNSKVGGTEKVSVKKEDTEKEEDKKGDAEKTSMKIDNEHLKESQIKEDNFEDGLERLLWKEPMEGETLSCPYSSHVIKKYDEDKHIFEEAVVQKLELETQTCHKIKDSDIKDCQNREKSILHKISKMFSKYVKCSM